MSLDNTVFHGSNNDDENDFVYVDTDDDGDLDVLVGTLQFGPTPEKLFINSGPIFGSGGVKNLLAETTTLSMSLDNTVFHGSNNDDENDFVYVDTDDDGDLDVLVGTLQFGPTPEKPPRS
jgi:hypothetical protein